MKSRLTKLICTLLVCILVVSSAAVLMACPGPTPFEPDIYTITYQLDEGTIGEDFPTEFLPTAPPVIGDAERDGYNFLGWTVEELNITEPTAPLEIPLGTLKNLTLTANWEFIEIMPEGVYSITYRANGGVNDPSNPATYSVTEDEFPITIQPATRFGYEFLGWTSELNSEPAVTVDIPADYEGNLIFTASWKKVPLQEPAGYGVGKLKAPTFNAFELNGTKHTIADNKGLRITLISFWKYDCGQCKPQLMGVFNKVYQQRAAEFKILAVHSAKESNLKAFPDKSQYLFTVISNESLSIVNSGYAVGSVPLNYVVDIWGYLYHPNAPDNSKTVTDFAYFRLYENTLNEALDGANQRVMDAIAAASN